MYRKLSRCTSVVLLSVWAQTALAQLGINPVPVFTTVTVQTAVSLNSNTGVYSYNYTIINPITNTNAAIYRIEEDLSAPLSASLPTGSGFTLPEGHAGNVPFDTVWAQHKGVTSIPVNLQPVPFGVTAPSSDWVGTLTVVATGGWHALSLEAEIQPGQTQSGFDMVSYGSPTIRAMKLKPEWILDLGPTATEEPTEAQLAQAAQIERSLPLTVYVLGPSVYNVDIGTPLNQLVKDVAKGIQLGWLPNATLAAQIQSQLQTAQALYGSEGPDYDTFVALKTVLNTVTSAPAGQLTADGRNLLQFALSQILSQVGNPSPALPPAPPPPTPKVTITSPASRALQLPVGGTATIVATIVDAAHSGTPLVNYQVPLSIASGPNAGTQATLTSDAAGTLTYSYSSMNTGVDVVSLQSNVVAPAAAASRVVGARPLIIAKNPVADSASVVWNGGPDLVVQEFTPPQINWNGQTTIHLTDTTANIGNVAELPSTTQYFISTQSPVDPTTAVLLGGRSVPALAPGASNFFQSDLPIPSQFQAPGTYLSTAAENCTFVAVENCTL